MIEDQTTPTSSESYVVSGGRREGWTVKVGPDLSDRVCYEDSPDGAELLRVHYRISRSPSSRRYVLRHFYDASDADRAAALQSFRRLSEEFDRLEAQGFSHRYLDPNRHWVFYMCMGTIVEDPLIQLELELMIDLTSKQEAAA